MRQLPLILSVLLVGCGRPGDGREGGSSKHEWGILQSLEATNRGSPIKGVEITTHGDYKILSLMAADRETRLWIILDPKSPPFYKQMPSKLYYRITMNQLEQIRLAGSPITTVYQSLESHLETEKAAEQDEDDQAAAALE